MSHLPYPGADDIAGSDPSASSPDPADPSALQQLGRDSAYLLATLPVAIVSFTLLITGISLAAGLLVTVIGIPVAVATLALAVGFERAERARLGARGTTLEPVVYAPPEGTGLRRMVGVLRDPRRWAAVLHGVGALPLSVATWSIAVTWWAGALGGLTYWFWERWLPSPDTSTTLVDLLDLPLSDSALNLLIGLFFAATLVPVLRSCVAAHAGWARLLLTGASRQALAAQVDELNARRSAAAAAEAQSLRRLERDIHDGPQQRLVRLGMDLSSAERTLEDDPAAARELLAGARALAAETLTELRALSRGIAPPILADRGLAAALTAVAARSSVPTSVEVDLPAERPTPAIENAAYFVASEALANTAKHAAATSATVRVRYLPTGAGVLRIEVHDDGRGGAALGKGHGLAGLADRVAGLGGTLDLVSPVGGPTSVVAELPLT
ncbi:sensor domain-containing protein [Cellulomonas sp. KRMCY2]|uniref:sensor histidine kinase n=1 Tax=Cellulomonas sp. KRMCY2 TaxID=1304865 RepID=UPI00045E869A|nr:sensor domain-containing protein [Cellulomonas sp. KRMCY2]